MKRTITLLLSLLIILLSAVSLYGCGAKKAQDTVYKCTTDGLSDFTITIYKNGEFTYTEALHSDYLGVGTWELDGDKLTLIDIGMGKDDTRVFTFTATEDTLVFDLSNSDTFRLNPLPDGTVFNISSDTEK